MEPFSTLPVISLYEVDGEIYRYPVRLFRADHNICERSGARPCDTADGVYYGCDPDAGKLCPRHFYEDHFGPGASCKLVDCSIAEAAH
jgi:hypothetical protein